MLHARPRVRSSAVLRREGRGGRRNPQSNFKNQNNTAVEGHPAPRMRMVQVRTSGIGQSDRKIRKAGQEAPPQPPVPPTLQPPTLTTVTRCLSLTLHQRHPPPPAPVPPPAPLQPPRPPPQHHQAAPPQHHRSSSTAPPQHRRPLRQRLLLGVPCLVSQRAGVAAVLPRPPDTCGACSARRARPKAPRLTQMRPVGGPCGRAPSSIAAQTLAKVRHAENAASCGQGSRL